MKTVLQTRLGQQLTLTPQLRQAIRLLQLSAAELELEINAAVEANPLLELTDDAPDAAADGPEPNAESGPDEAAPAPETEAATRDDDASDFEAPPDFDWDDGTGSRSRHSEIGRASCRERVESAGGDVS